MSNTALSSVCPSPCPYVTVVAEEAQLMGAGGILHSDCNKVLFCPSTGNTYGAGRGWVPHSIIWGGEALQSSSISLGCCTSVWNHVSPERLSAAPNWGGFSTFFFGVLFFFLFFFLAAAPKRIHIPTSVTRFRQITVLGPLISYILFRSAGWVIGKAKRRVFLFNLCYNSFAAACRVQL